VRVIGQTLHEAAHTAEVLPATPLGGRRPDGGRPGPRQAAHPAPDRCSPGDALHRPDLGNALLGILKGTSIVSVPAVHDLPNSAQLVYNQTYQVIPLLMVATPGRITVTTVLSAGQFWVEPQLRAAPPGAARRPTVTGEPPAGLRSLYFLLDY
jgi:polar amino acid transport system permease protein